MLSIDFTFLWTAINLIILYIFLKKALFDKVGKYMDDRAKKIEDSMERAKQLQSEGESFLEQRQGLLEAASQNRFEILKEAKDQAEREYSDIVAEARRESSRILAKADRDISYEREQMMKTLRNDVVSLAMSAASKVLEENMDNDKNRKMVHDFLDKEGVA